MIIKTKEFGEIEIQDNDVIEFKHPIYGFNELVKYVVLTDDELGSQIIWLQSVEDANVCFVLFNMSETDESYQPVVGEDIKALLDVKEDNEMLFCSIAVIREDYKESTINLKSPIIINSTNKLGAQVILDDDYPIRHKIFGE